MRGGARNGAGRPKGAATRRSAEIRDMASQEGITPLEYMLSVLRDETNDKLTRMDAAKSAAPFIHPRLAAVEHSGNDEKPLSFHILTAVPDADEDDQPVSNGHDAAH